MVVQLRWLHQFQFAGYYAALEKGFYRDAGLDVVLVEGGPHRDPIEEVLSGRAQYGAASNEVLLARLNGKPVKVLAVIFQQSPSVFLARKDSGINSPQDMLGRRVMMMPGMGDAELLAMFAKEGIDLKNIRRLPTSYNIDDLINGKTDVFNAYLTNEPYYLEKKGIPATIIRPAAYGIHFYGDCVVTSEDEVDKHPERVRAFRRATLDGWQYAMDHPEEIIDLILKKYHAKKTRDHLRFEAASMRELLQPEMIQMGHMNPGRWRHMAETFAELGLVPSDFNLQGLIYDPEARKDRTPWLWAAGIGLGVLLIVGTVTVLLARFNRRLRREVDERKRAEERVAAMVANVPGVIFQMEIFDDGRREYRYLSPRAAEFFGLDPEEIIRERRRLCWHPADRERVEREVDSGTAAGGVNLVGRVLLPDGRIKWVRVNASFSEEDPGKRVATGFMLDITKRKVAENEYLAGERKIKAMSQAVEDALIMIDGRGKVLFWNPAAERLFGYSEAEAMGMDFHRMAAPDEYREKVLPGLKRFSETGEGEVLGKTTEIMATDCRGRKFPVEVTLSAFQLDEEWYAVGTVRDISARKQAEKAAKDSERRMADIIEFLPDPTLVVDNMGRVLFWNRAMEKLTGIKKADIIGKADYEYALALYGERRPILVDLVRSWNEDLAEKYLSIKKQGDYLAAESFHPHLGDGGIFLSSTATVLFDAGGNEIGAIENLRDITEKKQAEALMVEKKVAEEAAARAERARLEAEAARRELQANLKEIARFNRLALGREERIIELKHQANQLASLAGMETPYDERAMESGEGLREEEGEAADQGEEVEMNLDRLAKVLSEERFHNLLHDFCEAAGVAAAIIDTQGEILAAARWQRVCTDFHRQNDITCARCIESDTKLAAELEEGKAYAVYRCRNGLMDAASPIVIEGKHLANTFVGQFFTEPPDEESFRRRAEEVGFDPEQYLAAVAEVPVLKGDRLPAILGFVTGMSRTVAASYSERLRAQQAEAGLIRREQESRRERAAALSLAEDAENARAEIERYKGRLELLVEERTDELMQSEERTRLLLDSAGEGIFGVNGEGEVSFINPAALEMLGYAEAEIMGRSAHALFHHSRADGSEYPADECPMNDSWINGATHRVGDEVLWRKDGRSFPVEYSSTPINKAGRVVGAVITFFDVSERRLVEEEMNRYVDELERFNRLTVGREERMIELKEEVNLLLEKAGRERKYHVMDLDATDY